MRRPPDPDVVEIVTLTNLCQAFNQLPKPGGILDQDSYTMFLMTEVLKAQNEASENEARKGARRGA